MLNATRMSKITVATLLAAALCYVGCGGTDAQASAGQRKAQAREMVKSVLNNWDWKTWNRVLDENVVLSLNVGTVGTGAVVGDKATYKGREAAKTALREFYGDLKKNVSFWGEIAENYEVALFGDLRVLGQAAGGKDEIPLLAYLKFNDQGKVTKMTLATVDMRPLVNALKMAAEKPAAGKQKTGK